jgi:ABC-type branched-subunit amino acid transport system ATPase component
VEHHMELIMNICSLIHVLDFGKKIAEGEPEAIKKNEQVLQAYLGEEV